MWSLIGNNQDRGTWSTVGQGVTELDMIKWVNNNYEFINVSLPKILIIQQK